jgi:tetratricopeptide (TPR) repeat protein
MKKTAILILSLLMCGSGFAQDQRVKEKDSLRKVIQTTTIDTARVLALNRLSLLESKPSLRFELAYKALQLSKQIKWVDGEARSYHQLSNCYRNISDLPNAMDNALKALKKREEVGNPEGIGTSLQLIGNTYLAQERYQEAFNYLSKAEEFYRKVLSLPAVNQGTLYMIFGHVYLSMHKYDSALVCFNRAYEIIPKTNGNLVSIYTGLANVYTVNKEFDLAQSYRKKAIDFGTKFPSVLLPNAYFQYALYFDKVNKRDSAIYYAQQSMELATQIDAKSTIIDAAKLLSTFYEQRDAKEALRYYKIAAQMKDSIFNQVSAVKLQAMEYTERERQREQDELKRVQKEERQNNLQYAAIALGLVALVIGFLVLSHSVIANQKLIRFLGVISLLIVFEFLNLLLHPWLGSVTHHSPLLMLLAMVCVAALLVPLHHRIEHWITHKMVEKNNRIRLAAAKRTIQQLEGGTEAVMVNNEKGAERKH